MHNFNKFIKNFYIHFPRPLFIVKTIIQKGRTNHNGPWTLDRLFTKAFKAFNHFVHKDWDKSQAYYKGPVHHLQGQNMKNLLKEGSFYNHKLESNSKPDG